MSRLAPYLHDHCALAGEKGRRPRFLLRVLDLSNVGHANRRASLVGDDDLPELCDPLEAAGRSQHDLGVTLVDAPARDLDVVGDDRFAHLTGAEPVRRQLLDVQLDVHFASASAIDGHLAHTVDGLERATDSLVGDLGERPQPVRACQGDGEDRLGVRIHLGDDRGLHLRRQAAHRAGHLFTNVLGRLVDVPFEDESDGDARIAHTEPRFNLVDAGNARQRLLERFGHRRAHFVGARAGQAHVDGHGGRVSLRQQIDVQIPEGEEARDHQGHDQHGGECRASDAELGESHRRSPAGAAVRGAT